MKHLIKRSLALLCMLALLLSVLPAAIAAEGETEFVVLSTTDMHGRTWDRNVLNDTNMNNSMLNVATAVAKMRETYGENVVLVDAYDRWCKLHATGVDTTELLVNHVNHPNRQMHQLFADALYEKMFF